MKEQLSVLVNKDGTIYKAKLNIICSAYAVAQRKSKTKVYKFFSFSRHRYFDFRIYLEQ